MAFNFLDREPEFNRIGSKGWANEQLRFAISVLEGKGVVATWKGRLQIALYVKDRLDEYGFWWQAMRIENWIHRLQPRLQPRRG